MTFLYDQWCFFKNPAHTAPNGNYAINKTHLPTAAIKKAFRLQTSWWKKSGAPTTGKWNSRKNREKHSEPKETEKRH